MLGTGQRCKAPRFTLGVVRPRSPGVVEAVVVAACFPPLIKIILMGDVNMIGTLHKNIQLALWAMILAVLIMSVFSSAGAAEEQNAFSDKRITYVAKAGTTT